MRPAYTPTRSLPSIRRGPAYRADHAGRWRLSDLPCCPVRSSSISSGAAYRAGHAGRSIAPPSPLLSLANMPRHQVTVSPGARSCLEAAQVRLGGGGAKPIASERSKWRPLSAVFVKSRSFTSSVMRPVRLVSTTRFCLLLRRHHPDNHPGRKSTGLMMGSIVKRSEPGPRKRWGYTSRTSHDGEIVPAKEDGHSIQRNPLMELTCHLPDPTSPGNHRK